MNTKEFHKSKIKLHLCCGDIYLKGYINIDIKGTLVGKCIENPNLTTLKKYYKFPFGTEPREFILDRKMDILQPWSFHFNSIDEVLMVSAIEHFTLVETEQIIRIIFSVLKHGGVLKIDFPDIMGIIQKRMSGEDDWNDFMRQIYCNHKNKYSIHKWGYCKKTFTELLNQADKDWNWKSITFKDIVEHSYPMIGCEAIKL